MRVYLNAGFGSPLPPEDLELIFSLGFDGIRQDVKAGMEYPDVAALVTDALYMTGVRAIFVCETAGAPELGSYVARAARALAAQDRAVVEVGNEEDAPPTKERPRYQNRPDEFGRLVADTARAVGLVDSGVRVISGGTRSTSQEAIDWIRFAAENMPAEVGIGYHTYRSGPPDEPLEGYRSRGDEFARLRNAAGGRAIYNTEVGWSTAPKRKGFPLCWQKTQLTDLEVLSYLRTELRINQMHGAESMCVYQWGDGPDPNNDQDRFGLRRLDGSLKPQSEVCR